MRSLVQTTSIAVLFGALAIIPFFIPLFEGFGALQWDAREVHLANLLFSSETWHAGFMPLWSPFVFGGFPQIADLQVALWYPVNLLIIFFAPFTQELLFWQIVFHYALAGFGMFLLARHITNSAAAGLFAGFAYMFCGFMVGHASHVGMQNTAAWFPIVFLLMLLALERASIAWAASAGVAMGIAVLAGHFQMSLFVLFTVCLYWAFETARDWWTEREVPWRQGLIFAVFGTIAALVAAVQLLPTFELAAMSERAAIPLELAQTESLVPDSLRGVITANYQNVAFGNYTGPWDRTQNYLFLGVTTVLLAVSCLLQRKWLQVPLIVFLVGLGTVALLYSFGKYGFLHQYFYLLPFFSKMRAPSNMMLVFDFAVILLAAIGLARLAATFPKARIIALAVAGIVLAELLPYAAITELTYARKDPDTIFEEPWIVQTAQYEYARLDPAERFRLWRVPELERNVAQVARLYDFEGYNPLELKRQTAYTEAMTEEPKLVDLAGIKYLPCELIPSRAAAIGRAGALCINETYLPRAFLVGAYEIAENESDALAKLKSADVAHTLILEEGPGFAAEQGSGRGTVSLQEGTNPNELVFDVDAEAPALLFIGQTFYPGWRAFVDNKEARLLRTNHLFQALAVPEGMHRIQLRFESPSLKKGALLSMMGLFAWMGILGYAGLRKKRVA